MKNEVQLIESKELREKCINRIEVLDKVKSILSLIPQTEFATTKQVAEYYKVGEEAIKTVVFLNNEELLDDGLKRLKGVETKDYLVSCGLNPTNRKGYFECCGENFAYKSNNLFPKRAILRIGMLLRDSEVAKKIRDCLLDIFQDVEDKAPEIIQQVVAEITIEQQLEIEVGKSYMSGDLHKFAEATMRLNNYRQDMHNKRVSELENDNETLFNDNKALANGILEWEDKSKLNKGIRVLAGKVGIRIGDLWLELYNQLLYKYHINLKARNNGKKPYINNIKENEWENVIKCFSALCKYYGYSPTELINQLEVE